jgi:hypothetical protein
MGSMTMGPMAQYALDIENLSNFERWKYQTCDYTALFVLF